MTEITPITLADLPEAASVLADANNRPAPPDGAARLQWLLFESPGAPADIPRGWVARADGRIVGLMGNVLRRMWWDGREVWTAATAKYAVLKSHGLVGLLLAKTYFAQQGVEKLFISTGSETSNPITTRFGAREIAGATKAAVFPLRPGAIVRATLRERGWNSIAVGLVAPVAGWATSLRRRIRIKSTSPAWRVHRVERFGDPVDQLWTSTRGRCPITSVRTAEVLNWLFIDGPATRPHTQVWAVTAENRWLGYAVTQDRAARFAELRRRHVMDLFLAEPDALFPLLHAIVTQAKSDQAASLEFRNLLPATATALERCGGWPRTLSVNPMLAKSLQGEDAPTDDPMRWSLVPADGDGAGW